MNNLQYKIPPRTDTFIISSVNPKGYCTSFNKAPFQDFVQQIVVNGPNNVVFKLKCGLRLTEKLTKAAGLDENFYRGVIRQRFNEPIRQAEYLYSIIESEGDLIG